MTGPTNRNASARLERTLGEPTCPAHRLHLLFLGLELNEPYGPIQHTAGLFLDLLCKAALEYNAKLHWTVSIQTFNCHAFEYPTTDDLDEADGVILPGSFSSAYDTDEWIMSLRDYIQSELVANQRKTLGICFGHQIMAHSFDPEGLATKTPTGSRAGRQTIALSRRGQALLSKASTIDLYCTHGDMVAKIPPQAAVLASSERVPIESVAYYGSVQDKETGVKPIAITFQAHPEYASSLDNGVEWTLNRIDRGFQATRGRCRDI
jgi:GMP synthase-like glutamine amidotransferase